MPNAILTRAIDALAQRRDLSADETAEVLDRDHARRGLRDADRGLSDRAAHEGRDGRRAHRAGAHDARAGRARPDRPHGPARHRRHGRWAQHVQRLHDRRPDRGGRRDAPWPSTAIAPPPAARGRPICWRRSGARIDLGPGGRRGVHRGGRVRVHVRARPPPGDALRRCPSDASWRCARSSTSSARSPTRPARGAS